MTTTPYLDRAREMNRRMIAETDSQNSSHAMKHIAAALFLCAAGMVAGVTVPMSAPDKTYDLVRFVGLESDIIDHGLSIDDCSIILPTMRAAGNNVDCRSSNR